MKKQPKPQYVTTSISFKYCSNSMNAFVDVYEFEGRKLLAVQQDNGLYFQPNYINIYLN